MSALSMVLGKDKRNSEVQGLSGRLTCALPPVGR